jgi:hypothetical protein
MIQALIAGVIFSTGLGTGGYLTALRLNSEIHKLEAVAAKKDAISEEIVSKRNEQLTEIYFKNTELNNELEKGNAQSVATINTLHERLVRLSEQPYKSRSKEMPRAESACTKYTEGETEDSELSRKFRTLLVAQALEADKLNLYATNCYTFVTEQNCGIPR